MFYVKIEAPINLKGERQNLYSQIHQKFGVKYGIHCVSDGKIHGEKGAASYWDYLPILEKIPTLIGHMNKALLDEVAEKEVNKEITMNLFWENGLLLDEQKKVLVLEKNECLFQGDNEYLLLCKIEGYYFQVIVPKIYNF